MKTKAKTAIALDLRGYQINIFLISPQNVCCGYSLEVPQHAFYGKTKKNISRF